MDSEAAATTGKKKKKKGAAKEVETEAVQATDDVHDAPRNTEGRTESGEEKQDTTEDAGPAGPADADAEASKKKKKKKKAKGNKGEDGIPEEEVEAEAGEAEERGLALEAVPGTGYGAAAAGLEEAPEDEAEEAEEGDTGKKKKKRRGKKKGGGGTVSGLDGIANYGISDEDFDAWCQKTLEATANESEKMSSQDLQKPPREFWGYQYSGNLRPAYVSKQLRMPEGTLLPDYALQADGSSACERQGLKEVPVLEGKELETMRRACKLGREVLDTAARFMRPGVTGDEIDRVVYQACIDRKIYPSPLNYYRFPKTLCVSANEVICHGIPDCRPCEEGDIVNLDISIYFEGFHSDLNETFFIGDCDEDSQRLVRTAYNALFAAAQMIRPGTFYRDLGAAIQSEASKNGCAVVTTYCGHGVGKLFHGPPKVPHYKKNKAVGIMKPGHVFTVEPMLNLGGNGGDRTWPDNWTAVTRDGKRSAQFEHTFLVTETGLEVLTARPGTDLMQMPAYNPAMFQR